MVTMMVRIIVRVVMVIANIWEHQERGSLV